MALPMLEMEFPQLRERRIKFELNSVFINTQEISEDIPLFKGSGYRTPFLLYPSAQLKICQVHRSADTK